MMEAEVGVMWPQAQECQVPLEGGGVKEWIMPWSVQGELSLLTP